MLTRSVLFARLDEIPADDVLPLEMLMPSSHVISTIEIISYEPPD